MRDGVAIVCLSWPINGGFDVAQSIEDELRELVGEVTEQGTVPDEICLPMAEYRKINPEGAIILLMKRSGNSRQRRRTRRAAQREIRALPPRVDRDAWALAE